MKTKDTQKKEPAQLLLCRLARELYQTETSSMTHSRREAGRLGEVPPATAMLDVAQHADQVVKALPQLFEARRVELGFVGSLYGLAFSTIRRLGLDFLMGQDRSYRFTLGGMRHGIDLVYELELLAKQLNDEELTEWCRHWLERRVPLVTVVEQQLQWFVTHPERALEGA